MRVLYFDCSMGAAGDMLMAALLELHPDPQVFLQRLNSAGIPGVTVERLAASKCGIVGTGIKVAVNGIEEDDHLHDHAHEHHHDHDHDHDHDHSHDHSDHTHDHHHTHEHFHSHDHRHTGMGEISRIISGLDVSDKVKADAEAVYNLIARAEAHAHGRDIDHIHFHEVGTMDAVADIVGVCMLMEELSPDRVLVSRVHVGSGTVRCAHGILPVPAPATAHILMGVPTYGGAVDGELCTPTGAALLRYFADEFVTECSMAAEKIGYGMGKRRFFNANGTEILSAVRAMLGAADDPGDKIAVLSCNIDDMTGEQLGFACEQLLSGGALDVFTTPVYMKKNRPGVLLTVICRPEDEEQIAALIFRHTTTLGIRRLKADRYILSRRQDTVSTDFGPVRVKWSDGYGTSRSKVEYDDLARIARENNISLAEAEKKLK